MDKAKKNLLNNLREETYCRIGVSKIAGVGVIAVCDIPENVDPFKIAGVRCPVFDAVKLTKQEVNSLPLGSRRLIKDFVYQEKDGSYLVPKRGMNDLNVSFYMNHSKKPNVDIIETNCEFMEFRTNKVIKKGEELLIDYSKFAN